MEQSIESSRIYDGRILNLRVDKVRFPDGKSTTREIVEHRGAAAIVPILEDGRVVLVRQFRYAVGSNLLEIPAGTLEVGENPMSCATRELQEETGYVAGEMVKIAECYVAPGYSTERIHFYLAKKLVHKEAKTEEDERIHVEVVPFKEALRKIRTFEVQDAKTICGLYTALELL
jgi:ADP-ribose pyrophosphatase